jgi:hypothetical protein
MIGTQTKDDSLEKHPPLTGPRSSQCKSDEMTHIHNHLIASGHLLLGQAATGGGPHLLPPRQAIVGAAVRSHVVINP